MLIGKYKYKISCIITLFDPANKVTYKSPAKDNKIKKRSRMKKAKDIKEAKMLEEVIKNPKLEVVKHTQQPNLLCVLLIGSFNSMKKV